MKDEKSNSACSRRNSASPAYPIPEPTADLDKSEFSVTTNSQQGRCINSAFDGTPETIWHSCYNGDPNQVVMEPPFIIDIGLNRLYAVNGFEYMARQNLGNGCVKNFEIYVSRSPNDYGQPVYTGSFERVKELQTIHFPVVWGEYVRFTILTSYNGNKFGSAAELNVLRDIDAPPLPEKVIYLSDMKPLSAKGSYKKDRSIGGKTITVNGQKYEKGLGVKANSELVYQLDGTWDRLSGHVGMDEEVGDKGSVMFRVFADDKLIFESPSMTGKNIKQLMELVIKGINELRLVLTDLGDGNADDHGDWIDVKLIRKGSERD